MNSLELIDRKTRLQYRAEEIVNEAEKDDRVLTDEEKAEYDKIIAQIEELNKLIDTFNQKLTDEGKMQKFSLIQTISDVANNKPLDEATTEIIEEARSAMRKAGVTTNGQIVIPMEKRATNGVITAGNKYTADTYNGGKENVANDVLGILEPLRANLAMVKAGATFMTGLVGDVTIPVYDGSNVGWKGETVAADNGTGNFSEVVLSPKRLTAYVDISKQFLLQDSNSAEDMLKRDIVAAISEKLEKTILGAAAGSTTQPAGLFNGVTADTSALTYADVLSMESSLEDANVSGDIAFIVSPSAKAILKSTKRNEGSMIMEDGEIEGYPVYTSSAVAAKGVVMGNFSDYVIAQWGGFDVTVDPYTQAANGMVRLVINAYFDAKPRRASAFAKKVLK